MLLCLRFFFFFWRGIGLDDGCVLRPIAVIIVPTNGMFQQTDVSFLFRVPAWTGMWENGSRLSWATVESVFCCYGFSGVCFVPGVLYPTYVLCRGTEGNMFRFEDECGLPAKKKKKKLVWSAILLHYGPREPSKKNKGGGQNISVNHFFFGHFVLAQQVNLRHLQYGSATYCRECTKRKLHSRS